MKDRLSIVLDKFGICASVLCMVHCLALPIFMILGFEVMIKSIDQEWIETAIILSSLIIGGVSFMWGFWLHKKHYVPILFFAGFLLILNGESVANERIGLFLTLAGAGVIIYSHLQNMYWKNLSHQLPPIQNKKS
ncbi:MerC domain-containing protein [Algoriphagus sediminis]|uniref:MerC domain-containing protein n=1 Tax=Algoriphagus sediminis TaxID=3057113 RepID=A0ABT7YD38_9BACT|nr:MerC domain-containing protein [Algoriphagus sediminis]MDN3204442.1 MerC domain-containing protein [Algoriphagus sediminis]